jgi:hypothetical protein
MQDPAPDVARKSPAGPQLLAAYKTWGAIRTRISPRLHLACQRVTLAGGKCGASMGVSVIRLKFDFTVLVTKSDDFKQKGSMSDVFSPLLPPREKLLVC